MYLLASCATGFSHRGHYSSLILLFDQEFSGIHVFVNPPIPQNLLKSVYQNPCGPTIVGAAVHTPSSSKHGFQLPSLFFSTNHFNVTMCKYLQHTFMGNRASLCKD